MSTAVIISLSLLFCAFPFSIAYFQYNSAAGSAGWDNKFSFCLFGCETSSFSLKKSIDRGQMKEIFAIMEHIIVLESQIEGEIKLNIRK